MPMDDKLKQAITLAREHYQKRDYAKCERYLARIMESEAADFADIRNMMGVIHHDCGRLEEAKECFEKALQINANYTEASLNLAVACNDLGDYEHAQDVYRQAMSRNDATGEGVDHFARGKIANLHAEVAQAYVDLAMPNEAIQQLRGAIRLCPTFADLRIKLADVYQQVGDMAAAKYELSEAIRVRPDYAHAHVAMGVILLVTGQRARAIEEWDEALRLNPDDRSAQMYLRVAKNPPVRSVAPPD